MQTKNYSEIINTIEKEIDKSKSINLESVQYYRKNTL